MKKRRRFLKFIGAFLIAALFGGLAIILIGLTWIVKISKNLPNPEQFVNRPIVQSTKIYDRTGKILLYEIHGEEKRTVIPFKDIPDYVKQATLSIEDQNFYNHKAFDWRAIIRALAMNIIKGKVVQGGSTITQQLAKNAFLTPERTFQRKVKELVLAYWIEKNYSKDEILNLYLNQISYGANAYGIESASQTYFAKSAKNLTIAEAAALAALPRAPSYYSPWGAHLEDLESRRDYILEQMQKLDVIDVEEKERAQNAKLKFAPQTLGAIKAPHFVMMVRDYLIDKYGEEMVEKGGLEVITTLDWRLEEIAEQVVKEGVENNTQLYQGKNGALIAQDAATGQILALVGSKDYFNTENQGNFNVATQGLRQPGSALKPFVYLTAFRKGYLPETIVFDVPTEFVPNNPLCPIIVNFNNELPQCFHPQNFDKKFRGPVNLRQGLAQSLNIPSVKVLYLVGLEEALKTTQSFGINTLINPSRYGLSLVLGGGEVKMIELINSYAALAQDGVQHQQVIILEVKNSKKQVLERYIDQATQVVEPQYARLVNDVLSDIQAREPLFRASLSLTTIDEREIALKTGTTDDYRDAWAFGYTPSLVVGVWAGNNDNKPMQKQGGSILAAVPIWHKFMSRVFNEVLTNALPEGFNKPDSTPIIDKPILTGGYIINNEIHDTLYYIDKNDPLGPPLQDPKNDPQFLNWEIPLKLWIEQNQEVLSNIISSSTIPFSLF